MLWIKNVKPGLRTRTKIIESLISKGELTVKQLAEIVEVSESTILYHLNNMQKEEIVESIPTSPIKWKLRSVGYEPITSFFKIAKKKSKKRTKRTDKK